MFKRKYDQKPWILDNCQNMLFEGIKMQIFGFNGLGIGVFFNCKVTDIMTRSHFNDHEKMFSIHLRDIFFVIDL